MFFCLQQDVYQHFTASIYLDKHNFAQWQHSDVHADNARRQQSRLQDDELKEPGGR